MENVENCRKRSRTLCSAIIRNDKKVLLIRRTDYNVWELPGGGIEFLESPKDTVVREVQEETGLNVKPKKLLDAISVCFEDISKSMPRKNHLTIIVYDCVLIDYKKNVVLDSDHDDYQWIDPKYIPKIKNLAIGIKDLMKFLIT